MDRFPVEMPERRRAALAMLSGIGDGVGLITSTLKKHGLTKKKLLFFIGDNGAPLKIHKADSPLQGDPGGWDGSLNTPLNGEKGMLAEGGMSTPFLVAWPGTIPGGQVYEHPVSVLDVAATAFAVALIGNRSGLDGVNLLPHLTGENQAPRTETLTATASETNGWEACNGKLTAKDGLFILTPDKADKLTFITKSKLKLAGAVSAKRTLKTAATGSLSKAMLRATSCGIGSHLRRSFSSGVRLRHWVMFSFQVMRHR